MKMKFIAVFGALLLTAGCSTVMNGTSQQIHVTAHSGETASCELRDSKRSYQVQAPGYVTVKRGDGPLHIQCTSPMASGSAIIPESYDETSIWLGHASLAVDSMTGAYQKYPVQIIVPMTASQVRPQ